MAQALDDKRIAAFVARWQGVAGGAERANYTIFVTELCEALDLPKPGIAAGGELSAYQFEGPVGGGSLNGGTGFVDVYRRGHFILEAKQSRLSQPDRAHPELFDPAATAPAAPSGARYDQLMRDARRQAEQYARSLPGSHPPVPFLIVADIGRAFELYFDHAGNGRGYAFFPDKQRYRIALTDLTVDTHLADLKKTAAEVLRAIWTDPTSIDPRVRAADVTRDVAKKLALVSQHLEQEGRIDLRRRQLADAAHEAELIENTALFLMRVLFCMFAEDVGLLPRDRFTEFLQSCVKPDDPDRPGDLVDHATLRAGLASLWKAMDTAGPADARYAFAMRDTVRYFNGGLFASQAVFPLGIGDLTSLIDAARHSWTNVEPAIFGTLLEQALSPADRAKLGAHYTPRPYVERLVQATITDVLAPEWAAAEDAIRDLRSGGDTAGALARATGFLAYLQAQRVLDPACGTGNFLYVAMETLLRLESDVIETIAALGGYATPAIGPENFLGLELNPRAAVIAELVLWIGWLRWRTANDPAAVPDPVLARTGSINFGSVHGYDALIISSNDPGMLSIATSNQQPATSNQQPATSNQQPATSNQQAAWPEAEFIIGNPPFIGGKNLRERLGSAYAEDLWKVYPSVPPSADLVMQWWDRSAAILTAPKTRLRRFGFVTTNSITQEFSRRVIAARMAGDRPLSLVMACPDHPWTKATREAAAVRIAMTVAAPGELEGTLIEVKSENGLGTDQPQIVVATNVGKISAKLEAGASPENAFPLTSNEGIAARGVALFGAGFLIDEAKAQLVGLGRRHGLEAHIRRYRHGRDISQRSRDLSVIDFHGLTESEVRQRFPEAYDHLLSTVKPERDSNRRATRRDNWWLFGELAPAFRGFASHLPRYIATAETAKFRIFQFLDSDILPDNKLVAIGLSDGFDLGVLSSKLHTDWSFRAGGWLGVGNDSVYVKSKVFDPFPFPDPTAEQRAAIGDLGEELDATRKAALAEHPRLTMTGLYNLVEKLRAGATLTAAEEVDARDGRARIVRHLHDRIDDAVAAAYGWADEWRRGGLAPAEIVARLVALNATRAAEEAAGHIRWLRPDYQIPRFGRNG